MGWTFIKHKCLKGKVILPSDLLHFGEDSFISFSKYLELVEHENILVTYFCQVFFNVWCLLRKKLLFMFQIDWAKQQLSQIGYNSSYPSGAKPGVSTPKICKKVFFCHHRQQGRTEELKKGGRD